ncbi:MAG: hypothetical protein JO307_27265 [Bryobacterales bacterium]|nr:hypothetical protein [Bryobacterales bacterium]MBV9398772.1 hypothetical protein [Bryobacterales bacterium]
MVGRLAIGRTWAGCRLSCAIVLSIVFLLISCSKRPPVENEAVLRKGCLITAGGIAGGEVELLRFGHFAPNGPLDCVVAAALPDVESQGDDVAASRLLILRHQGENWRVALDVAKWATNPEGYVGVDSLDDTYPFKGLRVLVDDKTPTHQPGITLWISYLDENGADEGDAKPFALNPASGRYQEFDEKLGFKPEVRDPPHVRVK